MKTIEYQTYSTMEVCKIVGISNRQLEYWVLIGVVVPQYEPHGIKLFKRFNIEKLEILTEVKTLTDEGFLVSRAAQKVKQKREHQKET